MATHRKALRLRLEHDPIGQYIGIELDHRMATLANEKLACPMPGIRVRARHKGIERFELMHKPVRDQKIQCPINRRWRGRAGPMASHMLEQIVGLYRLLAVDNQLKDAPTQIGESETTFGAGQFHARHH